MVPKFIRANGSRVPSSNVVLVEDHGPRSETVSGEEIPTTHGSTRDTMLTACSKAFAWRHTKSTVNLSGVMDPSKMIKGTEIVFTWISTVINKMVIGRMIAISEQEDD